MKQAFFLIIPLAFCSCVPENSPSDPLLQAKELTSQGKYEEALQKHIWIHHHSLDSNPSYYGVRLSFALKDWIELGVMYPKALSALKEIREEKTKKLMNGASDSSLFHDVVAINQNLGESVDTVTLFRHLDKNQPEFAEAVYHLADEALINSKEYSLARKYMGDPLTRFLAAQKKLKEGLEYSKSLNKSPSRQIFHNIFTKEVVQIITVLDQSGEIQMARKIQSLALAELDTPKIRNSLKK